MREFFRRHARFEEGLTIEFRTLLKRYRASSTRLLDGLPDGPAQPAGRPFWYLSPGWLGRKFHGNRKLTPGFLADATWAQYCLFFAIRLQDDLLDKQTKDPALLFLADQYFLEAERRLMPYFPRSGPFWEYYLETLGRTARGILRTQEIHRAPAGNTAQLRRACGEVNALFTIGAAAVCHRAGHPELIPPIVRLGGAIAFAGQVVDDILDLEEDLEEGKLNYVARAILPRNARVSWGDIRSALRNNLIGSDSYQRMLVAVRCELEGVRDEVRGLGIPPAERYLRSCIAQFTALESNYLDTRLALLFRGRNRATPI